ncbi:MAG: glycosyltransferase family 4 protein [Deltaproteobacteria bacterium]|nr:glycosyltransferase family 4 protein [Deltaproteobacteria bacterium]
MRIIYWVEQYWPVIGGVQILGRNLIGALRDRGHEFIVVTSQGEQIRPAEEEIEGVRIYRFPFYQTVAENDLDGIARVKEQVARLKRTFDPHLIHLAEIGVNAAFHSLTAAAHPAPLIVTLQQYLTGDVGGPQTFLDRVLGAADWVVACSRSILSRVWEIAPDVRKKSSVIYNGVIEPDIAATPLPWDPPRLLCLGRLVNEKGFDVAIRAFAGLVEEFPALRLIIAGDGPERDGLQKLAAGLGIAARVEFKGFIHPEKVPMVLNSATAFVMPSRREAFGMAAAEAAMMRRPVLASRVGGLPEVVSHGETGLLAPVDDVNGFREAMADLLKNPQKAEQMGREGRRLVRQRFQWERHVVKKYEDLYRNLGG